MSRARFLVVASLALLLASAAWYAAARIASLNARVRHLEAECSRLQTAHQSLLEALLRGSPEEQARAKVEVIRELSAVPPPKSGRLGPGVMDKNSPPGDVRSK
jgi:hypothetical protein